jgi:hypothetical protein
MIQNNSNHRTIKRPFYRTCRPFVDGSYAEGGRWLYLLHPKFAKDPQHYIRAFLLLQQDLMELFAYIEPADTNLKTYSHRIQQLLMRTCVEIEANLRTILVENGYSKRDHLTMQDYRLVNCSHRLSSYVVRIPGWHGSEGVRRPFLDWGTATGTLYWYQAYNKSKHNRHDFFSMATFRALTEAMCGLVVVLSAQFHDEDYSPTPKSLSIGEGYSYDTDDGMESAIGNFFRVKYPENWSEEERYDFDWNELKELENPFAQYDYDAVARRLGIK